MEHARWIPKFRPRGAERGATGDGERNQGSAALRGKQAGPKLLEVLEILGSYEGDAFWRHQHPASDPPLVVGCREIL